MAKTTGGKKSAGTGSDEPTIQVTGARSVSSAKRGSAEVAVSVTPVARKKSSTSSAARAASVSTVKAAILKMRYDAYCERLEQLSRQSRHTAGEFAELTELNQKRADMKRQLGL